MPDPLDVAELRRLHAQAESAANIGSAAAVKAYSAAAMRAAPKLLDRIEELEADALDTRSHLSPLLDGDGDEIHFDTLAERAECWRDRTRRAEARLETVETHGCPHVMTGPEGTSHCQLAQGAVLQASVDAAEAGFAAEARTAALVETVRVACEVFDALGVDDMVAGDIDFHGPVGRLRSACDRAEQGTRADG